MIDIIERLFDHHHKKLHDKLEEIMSALTDLQAAVARNQASTTALLTAIEAKVGSSISEADVAAAAASVNASSDQLDAEAAKLAPPAA